MGENTKKMISGKIDGKDVKVPGGTTILEAAKSAGIDIPHFCYHPGVGIEGSCRMCLVEIKGNPKLQISCSIPFTEGIEVVTDSEQVIKARNGVLEFLLINHPLDCPICDKGGECPLQDYSYKYGTNRSRFEDEKRHLAKHKILGDHIIFDSERCILCSRCVRFYRDIIGTHELVIKKRGHKAQITSFMDKPIKGVYSGNLADICPVGALTTREFRFKARPWEMKSYDSVCAVCGLNCSLQVWKKEKRVVRLTPEYNPDVNGWWLCDKGRFSYIELTGEKRLKAPLLKEQDGFRELSGEEATTELRSIISDLVKRNGKESLKIISSADITNEEAWVLRVIAEAQERAGSVIFDIPKSHAELFAHLSSKGLNPKGFADLEGSEEIICLGTDLIESHPVLYPRIKRLVGEKGTKLLATHDFKTGDERIVHKRVGGAQENKKDILAEIKKALKEIWEEKGSPAGGKHVSMLVDPSWMTDETSRDLRQLIDDLSSKGILRCVVVAGNKDYNSFGILGLATTYFSWSEEIRSVLKSGSAKEVILIGDDLCDKFVSDPQFSADKFSFICMIRKFKSENTDKAQLSIPQRSFLEKDGTVVNLLGVLQRQKRTVRVIKDDIPEWKLLYELGKELGVNLTYYSEEDLYRACAISAGGDWPRSADSIKGAREIYTHYNRELRK